MFVEKKGAGRPFCLRVHLFAGLKWQPGFVSELSECIWLVVDCPTHGRSRTLYCSDAKFFRSVCRYSKFTYKVLTVRLQLSNFTTDPTSKPLEFDIRTGWGTSFHQVVASACLNIFSRVDPIWSLSVGIIKYLKSATCQKRKTTFGCFLKDRDSGLVRHTWGISLCLILPLVEFLDENVYRKGDD